MKPSVYEQIYGKRSWIYLGGLLLSLIVAGLCLWSRFIPSLMSAPTEIGNAPLVLPAPTPVAKPKEPIESGLPPAVAQGVVPPARIADTPVIPAGTDDLIYRVQIGNCLWRIAERHCGTGFRWPEIYRVNRHEIVDPDLIYPGQELQLPCGK